MTRNEIRKQMLDDLKRDIGAHQSPFDPARLAFEAVVDARFAQQEADKIQQAYHEKIDDLAHRLNSGVVNVLSGHCHRLGTLETDLKTLKDEVARLRDSR